MAEAKMAQSHSEVGRRINVTQERTGMPFLLAHLCPSQAPPPPRPTSTMVPSLKCGTRSWGTHNCAKKVLTRMRRSLHRFT